MLNQKWSFSELPWYFQSWLTCIKARQHVRDWNLLHIKEGMAKNPNPENIQTWLEISWSARKRNLRRFGHTIAAVHSTTTFNAYKKSSQSIFTMRHANKSIFSSYFFVILFQYRGEEENLVLPLFNILLKHHYSFTLVLSDSSSRLVIK